jgi:hypothetical protein
LVSWVLFYVQQATLPSTVTQLHLTGFNRVTSDLSTLTNLRSFELSGYLWQQPDTLRLPSSLTSVKLRFVLNNAEQPRLSADNSLFGCSGLQSLTFECYRLATQGNVPSPLQLSIPPSISALTSLTTLALGSRYTLKDHPNMMSRIVLPSCVSLPSLCSLTLAGNYVDIPPGFCNAGCRIAIKDMALRPWRADIVPQ